MSCRERIICTIYLHCSLLLILDNQFEAVNSSYEYRARPDSKEWDHLFVSIGNYQSGYFNGRGCLPGRSLWYSFLRGPFLYRVFASIFRHELFEVLKSFRIFCIICFGYSTKIFAPGNDVLLLLCNLSDAIRMEIYCSHSFRDVSLNVPFSRNWLRNGQHSIHLGPVHSDSRITANKCLPIFCICFNMIF